MKGQKNSVKITLVLDLLFLNAVLILKNSISIISGIFLLVNWGGDINV